MFRVQRPDHLDMLLHYFTYDIDPNGDLEYRSSPNIISISSSLVYHTFLSLDLDLMNLVYCGQSFGLHTRVWSQEAEIFDRVSVENPIITNRT